METAFQSLADNTWSLLQNATLDQEKQLYNELKVREKNYFFNPRFRAGLTDGFLRLYDLQKKRLLTGMIPFAQQVGFDFPEVITAKDPLGEFNTDFQLLNPETKEPLILNYYQQDVIDQVIQGARRGILDHLTSSGKTATMAAVLALLKPLQAVVIVPSIELLIQTREALGILLQEPIGQLGSGQKDFEHRVVCVYSGFIKQYDKSPFVKNLAFNTQVLVYDEVQTCTKRMFPFFKKCVNAYYRYAFSGSFFDVAIDRVFSVAGYFGGVISSVGDEETKAMGRTVPPHFTFFQFPVKEVDSEYPEMYNQCLVRNDFLNKHFADLLKEPYEQGKTILVLVKRVDHCKRFQQALSDIGVESEIYNGRLDTEKRRELRSKFKNGLLPVLVATEQTMGVGVNIPRIELLLNLGCGLSDNATKQKYGRSLRTFEGKDYVDIYEPYITSNRILLRHSKSRLAMAKRYATGNVKMVFLNGVEQQM